MAIDFWDRMIKTEELGRTAQTDSGFAVGAVSSCLMMYARGEIPTLVALGNLVKDCNGDPMTAAEKAEAQKLTDLIDAKSNATTKALEAMRIGNWFSVANAKYEFDYSNPDPIAAGLAERAAILAGLGVVDPKV